MIITNLCEEKWKMRDCESGKTYKAGAPASVLSVLLEAGAIQHPYAGENEKKLLALFEHDYEFICEFSLRGDVLQEAEQELVFDGLDTIAELYLNGEKLGRTKNMHRTYRFPVKDRLRMGDNELKIHFYSPLRYIRDYKAAPGKEVNWTNKGALPGGQLLRKAQSSFGWDWGPQLPDMGIFREIRLEAWTKLRLSEVSFFQEHEDGKVTLYVDPILEYSDPIPVEIEIEVSEQDKVSFMTRMPDPGVRMTERGENEIGIPIHSPRLWWPGGMGEQPLYRVRITLKKADKIYDVKEYRIGLRTIKLSREKDEYGEEFCFIVNGVKIFARGANYVPEDAIYPNITERKQERLLDYAKEANFNFLRIWGGGYYPSDRFYDMCDERGILVWQDLMYACNIYELTPAFEKSILAETRDNVRRLRHHACLALWCGNNEMESAWDHWKGFSDHSPALKADYIKMFEYLLPNTVMDEDESTDWWPSSPSSGGCFDAPDDENRGDTHFWEVWHGRRPYSEYRDHHFRFLSEFGFQSFPGLKTVKSFTKPEDRNIFSPVMESHQKNGSANGLIVSYISENFRYPKDFEQLLYVSQIQQGLAVECAVEHLRRERGRCMGTLYWQFNDNWPAASWSSVDYYGRWKALHYMAKRFYAPVEGSIQLEDGKGIACVVNDRLEAVTVRVRMSLVTTDGTELMRYTEESRVEGMSVWKGQKRDFGKQKESHSERELYVLAEFETDGRSFCRDAVFVPYKHMELKKPEITVKVTENDQCYLILLKSTVYAPFVMLDLKEADAIFSDNVFSLHKDKEMLVTVSKDSIHGPVEIEGSENFREQLQIFHLYDSFS
ncbi:MAG: glycoside hydrolase family 2 protein [Lachnospiraceae bacterium]|nr:glycoside hydrolase family 2 protein [Lachnospiraceae bacterium]